MGKYLLGLVGVGVLAFLVKSAADDAGRKLAAVRQEKPAAPAKVPERGTVVPFDDPLGCYRVMFPDDARPLTADGYWMHGVGRGAYVMMPEPKTRLEVRADFVGSDEPNTARQTLAWVTKKHVGRTQRPELFEKVKFSHTPAGAEVAEYEHEWRGNGARAVRSRLILYRKWLYTVEAAGLPDQLDEPEILTFFDTFALTEKALDHPDGGVVKP